MKGTLFVIFSFCICLAYAQPSAQSPQKETIKFLTGTESAISSLANAIPEEKYSWKPAEGVRTVSQVLMHVVSGNYYILMMMGIKPPPEIDMMNLEKITDKPKILEMLKASFVFVNTNLANIPDQKLGDLVKFPFGEFTQHGSLNLLIDHSGEHKGQLIAYARSVGIVPPWSN